VVTIATRLLSAATDGVPAVVSARTIGLRGGCPGALAYVTKVYYMNGRWASNRRVTGGRFRRDRSR